METLNKGQNICIICDTESSSFSNDLQEFNNLTYKTSIDVLKTNNAYQFNAVLVDSSVQLTEELIKKLYFITKPEGCICVRCQLSKIDNLELLLKTNGYINVTTTTNAIQEVVGFKPKYEIGSAVKLKLQPKQAVWKLNDINDDEIETIDPDNLLDDDDFIKPDQASLRVCGTTGKRKACKDCSCGLAEELNAEQGLKQPVNTSDAKSSCGSCYLGDAFRCASCPYLGMPAFKPGEKVQLPDSLLKADV